MALVVALDCIIVHMSNASTWGFFEHLVLNLFLCAADSQKGSMEAAPLQIKSFTACPDAFKDSQTQERRQRQKRDDRHENQGLYRRKSSKHM